MCLKVQKLLLILVLILINVYIPAPFVHSDDSLASWVVDSPLNQDTALSTPEPEQKSFSNSLPDNMRSVEIESMKFLTSGQKFVIGQKPASKISQGPKKSNADLNTSLPKKVMQTQAPQPVRPEPSEFIAEIEMDQSLWEKQPNTTFEIPFHKSIILRGNNIRRFLVLEEDFVRVDRSGTDVLVLTSLRRGSVLMHVWDDTGRWTFQIVGVIPPPRKLNPALEEEGAWVKHADHWTFSYTNNWNSFYIGNSLDNLARVNLNFVQTLSIDGPTPYGDLYAFASYFKFDESTERTGQGVGFVNGNIGPLQDFSVYGYDTSKRFSELSLPGRYFRGVRWDHIIWDRKLAYSFIYGKDRSNFRVISPGITSRQSSFITGAKIVLFPESENNYSINFARGFGEERPDELKSKVWSGQVNRRIKGWYVESELAHDEEDWAMYIKSKLEEGPHTWNVHFRNYEDQFATITNFPGDQGEAGAVVHYEWLPDNRKHRFYSNVDIYRDRQTFNPMDRKSLNYDMASGYSYKFNHNTGLNAGIFYTNTPQLISPREDIRMSSTLSKSFKTFYDRTISFSIGNTYQMSRFDLTPTSEFDRYSVTAGVRFSVIPNLNFFANYDHSWVDAVGIGEKSKPRVFNTGVSYFKSFGEKVSARTSVSWRDEQDADGTLSFLSGTDTLRGNVSVTYRPKEDIEVFLDGTVRNVLSETNDNAAFNDADLRFGMRTTWDLLFGWDPRGDVTGYVFKDINQNGLYDEEEPGVEHVVVRAGDERAVTDMYGRYFIPVAGKEVKVALDLDSLPKGFNITTDIQKQVAINNGKLHIVDFGLFTRTRIYGVVFVDDNANGVYDPGEDRIPRVGISLDNKFKSGSDFEGLFEFKDVSEGQHEVTIDINSIPFEFLPRVKLKHSVDVEEGGSYTINVPLRRR